MGFIRLGDLTDHSAEVVTASKTADYQINR